MRDGNQLLFHPGPPDDPTLRRHLLQFILCPICLQQLHSTPGHLPNSRHLPHIFTHSPISNLLQHICLQGRTHLSPGEEICCNTTRRSSIFSTDSCIPYMECERAMATYECVYMDGMMDYRQFMCCKSCWLYFTKRAALRLGNSKYYENSEWFRKHLNI